MSATEGDEPAPPAMRGDWRPLPAEAATTSMFGGSFVGLVLGIAAGLSIGLPVTTRSFGWDWWQGLLLAFGIGLLAAAIGCYASYRRWKTSAWKLDETGLRFRRGFLFRKEILVPRTRVQHLDIERGPIERHYGLATLIVHTAGTRHHALQIPGLADADAVALRDALVPVSARHDDVV